MGNAENNLTIDFCDPELFGNDAGEDEDKEVLLSYFVDQPAFSSFLNYKNKFCITRARKGMGKSALLSKLTYDLQEENKSDIIISTTGSNLVGLGDFPEQDHLILQNYWKQIICKLINIELGKKIGLALSDSEISMVEASELAGFKDRNIVGSLLSRLKGKVIPIEKTSAVVGDYKERLKTYQEKHKNTSVWLFVDDIDSTFVDSNELKARISTFFSACRSLVREVNGLNIRASVRTDVWSVIRYNEDLDKAEQYITDINWSAQSLRAILIKKILSYVQRNFPDSFQAKHWTVENDSDKIIQLVFPRRLRWGRASVPPFQPIKILSAGRPRWISQLCRLAGKTAHQNSKKLIGIQEINMVMKQFGRLRLNDLYKEHSHQYGDLERLIESFNRGPRRYSTKKLMDRVTKNYVFRVSVARIPLIDGYPYKNPMQLCHFLFKIGLIMGRKKSSPKSLTPPEFVSYEHRPELLTNTINPDDGMDWEIHPSYRQALGIAK